MTELTILIAGWLLGVGVACAAVSSPRLALRQPLLWGITLLAAVISILVYPFIITALVIICREVFDIKGVRNLIRELQPIIIVGALVFSFFGSFVSSILLLKNFYRNTRTA